MIKLDNRGIWVIGDVHGEFDKLISLIKKMPKDSKICFVGDLIDRGAKSAQVVEFIRKHNYYCVVGNHEHMTFDMYDIWLEAFSDETLESYKDYPEDAHQNDLKWFETLPFHLTFEIDGYKPLVVSHSYIHHVWRGDEHSYANEDDVIWRHMHGEKYYDADVEARSGIFNIFGHAIHKSVKVTDTYACVDTGAFKEDGMLSAIHYPTLEVLQA
jgi:serine/threonine protein phosphatase 1